MPPRPAPPPPSAADNFDKIVIDGLKLNYKASIKPIEKAYNFDAFHSVALSDADLEAAPMVLLIGQYSTGKTSFIRYLIEKDVPGMHIGPEPTTDRFVAFMHGDTTKIIPGNAAAVMDDKPFLGAQKFGMQFLNRFEIAETNSSILKNITLLDSPGILSGEKQRVHRQYDFPEVIRWFAGRADRIILLFDAHKLDISDEFKTAIEALEGQQDKIRLILNKSDSVSSQQLMRVYGSLLWSLGRVIKTPEVLRVFIGSFWDQPHKKTDFAALLKSEEADLLADLRSLPRNNAIRKINELVKRARSAKVHALICSHLRSQFGMFGKESKQKKLLEDLPNQFLQVSKKYSIPFGDFPSVNVFRDIIKEYDISKFPKLDQKAIDKLDDVLGRRIPDLMRHVPQASPAAGSPTGQPGPDGDMASPAYENPFPEEEADSNPFTDDPNAESPGQAWAIPSSFQAEKTSEFYNLHLASGKLSGANAKDVFTKLGLQKSDLRTIWTQADIDRDGFLDCDEYILATYLIQLRKRSDTLYDALPYDLVPPSKR